MSRTLPVPVQLRALVEEARLAWSQGLDDDADAIFDEVRANLAAWVGALVPGWTLAPPKRRPGRRAVSRSEQDTRLWMKKKVNEVARRLGSDESTWSRALRHVWKTDPDFSTRIVKIDRNERGGRILRVAPNPFPRAEVLRLVEQATEKDHPQRWLAYGLVGLSVEPKLAPDQVRGRLRSVQT